MLCFDVLQEVYCTPGEQLIHNSERLVDTDVSAGLQVYTHSHTHFIGLRLGPKAQGGEAKYECKQQQTGNRCCRCWRQGRRASMHMLNSGCVSSEDWHFVWELLGLVLLH